MGLFPPRENASTEAQTREKNKSRNEVRSIRIKAVDPEEVGFPMATQVAQARRDVTGRNPETVCLITSAPPERLDAAQWLAANRHGWGIETGLHARLDVSRHDDRCRLRNKNAIWVHGIFTRLANSLFMQWRSHWPKPDRKNTPRLRGRNGRRSLSKGHLARNLQTPTLKPSS